MLGAVIVLSVGVTVLAIALVVCLLLLSEGRSEGRQDCLRLREEIRDAEECAAAERGRANHHRERCRKLRRELRELKGGDGNG